MPSARSAAAVAAAGAHGLEHARLRTRAATTLLARLLVICDALDVLRQPFLLAHLLEPPQHLFGGLIAARLHLDHERDPFAIRWLNCSQIVRKRLCLIGR